MFVSQIVEYHKVDSVDAPLVNPYAVGTMECLLYEKSFIDTVQWHLEDIIRPDSIDPNEALLLKRRIDASNQRRTDMVERIDDCFVEMFKAVEVRADATLNTETPAWALDRLSILALKIYHFAFEANRTDADEAHKEKCRVKHEMLLSQREDLMSAIETLLQELADGKKRMKVYRQMKMYNDPATNPILYSQKQ